MKRVLGLLVISILLAFGIVALAADQTSTYNPYKETGSLAGYGTRVQYYAVPDGFPKFEDRTRFIGNIQGTWNEMGVQYGERAGDLIRYVSDWCWTELSKQFGPEHYKEDLDRYAQAIDEYSPQMIEFLKGIAKGAAKELAKSPYNDKWSDFQKIMACNTFPMLTFGQHPPQEFHKGKTSPMAQKTSMLANPNLEELGVACTGSLLLGGSRLTAEGFLPSPTKNGETIITQNMDVGVFAPWGWNVAYVATPNDPKANVFWSISTAGMAGSNNMCVNEKGLALSLQGGWKADDPDDFGIPWMPLQVYTIAYAENFKKAVELLTVGPPDYRARTGRKIVYHAGRWNYGVVDPDEAAIVAISSHRYSIRYPGDYEERGNYVIRCREAMPGTITYWDKDNVQREVPRPWKATKEPQQTRYWSARWFINSHLGEIDIPKAQEMMKMTWLYDMHTGKRIDFAEDRTPIYLKEATICNFANGDIGGTMWGSIASLKKNGKTEIWWTQGRPCEWLGPWQHIDFVGYLK